MPAAPQDRYLQPTISKCRNDVSSLGECPQPGVTMATPVCRPGQDQILKRVFQIGMVTFSYRPRLGLASGACLVYDSGLRHETPGGRLKAAARGWVTLLPQPQQWVCWVFIHLQDVRTDIYKHLLPIQKRPSLCKLLKGVPASVIEDRYVWNSGDYDLIFKN